MYIKAEDSLETYRHTRIFHLNCFSMEILGFQLNENFHGTYLLSAKKALLKQKRLALGEAFGFSMKSETFLWKRKSPHSFTCCNMCVCAHRCTWICTVHFLLHVFKYKYTYIAYKNIFTICAVNWLKYTKAGYSFALKLLRFVLYLEPVSMSGPHTTQTHQLCGSCSTRASIYFNEMLSTQIWPHIQLFEKINYYFNKI